MPSDDDILTWLRCPNSKQALRHATAEEKEARHIPAAEPAYASLDGSHLYRFANGMPVLLSTAEIGAAG